MNYFDEIIGYEDIKEKLLALDDYYKHPEVYEKLNAKPKTNILLDGKEGTGRSSLAIALAKTMGIPLYEVEKQETQEQMISEIKKVFADATENAPAFILLKNIDTYRFDESFEQEYNIIKSKIDEAESTEKPIFVFATSMHYESLPHNLRKKFKTLTMPDVTVQDAVKIADKYIEEKGYKVDFSIEDIVRMLRFKGCGQLKEILNDAAVVAANNRHEKITENDIMSVFLSKNKQQLKDDTDIWSSDTDKVTGHQLSLGLSNIIDKDAVYFHEAGHLLSLIIYENALDNFGYACAYEIENNNHYCGKVAKFRYDESNPQERIVTLLCAEAAVELFFEINDYGSESDYKKAIDLIREQVKKEDSNLRPVLSNKNSDMSDKLAAELEAVVHHELTKYKLIARSLIFDYKDMVKEFAKELKHNGYLLYSKAKEISSNAGLIDQSLL